ncbi:MAG: PIG-L deacetylase family protein [Planctomycetota bacterium]|nr:PIG-L deacetylase family protein [Planctomycetota bacterium]
MNTPLKILIIGAHPDDCDLSAGGSAALWRQLGHAVTFVSMTDGRSGHHEIPGDRLADIRRMEANAAGATLGIPYHVLDHPDGGLEATLENRLDLIRLIRHEAPDLVLTHRPYDYHPDHRYTGTLVCDAAYMVTVPAVAPDTPALVKNPVIAYLADGFTRPYPFSPTVAVDVEPVIDRVVEMLCCHISQFFEWLPHNMWPEDTVPQDEAGRHAYAREKYQQWIGGRADQHRDLLIAQYGDERGQTMKWIEAFEGCEYGAPLDDEAIARLFPFATNTGTSA